MSRRGVVLDYARNTLSLAPNHGQGGVEMVLHEAVFVVSIPDTCTIWDIDKGKDRGKERLVEPNYKVSSGLLIAGSLDIVHPVR